MQFIKISGGLDGGSEPPAFQRAERERLARARAGENAADSLPEPIKGVSSCKHPNIHLNLLFLTAVSFLHILLLTLC